MDMNRQQMWRYSIQSWISVALLLIMVGLIAWLGTRYHYEMDWTASGRHTLSESTQQLLMTLDEPVAISAFTRRQGEQGIRQRISELVARYQKFKPDLIIEYIDPDQEPERVRTEEITLDGELLITYQGRKEHLKTIGEQALTNALQRLARGSQRLVYFLEGHGERSFNGQANHDLARWTEQLKQRGVQFAALNLSMTLAIPVDASVIVIASPQSALLSGEEQLIKEYIAAGGNLLWLHDPKEPAISIIDELGIAFNEGTIVDPTGEILGIENPSIIVVPDYPEHAVTSGLTTLSLFPLAHAVEVSETESWQITPILQTLERSWSEHQPLQGTIQFDAESDQQGPHNIGVVLERSIEESEPKLESGLARSGAEKGIKSQRIAVIGDGDFISNAYLGNGANRELGDRLINWLSSDDKLITIPPKVAPDINLELTPNLAILFGFGFLILIPVLLMGSGVWIWLRRRQR